MIMAFTMPSVYGRYGPTVTFGFVFVLMVALTGAAAFLHIRLERTQVVRQKLVS
jgi:hypothetical protein